MPLRRTVRCVAPLAALWALALPAGAHAASVRVTPAENPRPAYVLYTAAHGEANDVTAKVKDDPSGGFDHVAEFQDDGAPLTAGSGCVQLGPNRARCGDVDGAVIRVGDRNDRLNVDFALSQYRFDVFGYGGPGDDTLIGSRYTDYYYGGDGADTIVGGNGRDDLSGGAGPDRLDGGRSEDSLAGEYFRRTASTYSDQIEGGRGRDTVYYYGGTDPVDIDLARGVGNSAPGETDHLTGVEGVTLGTGTGTIGGDERRNALGVGSEAGSVVLRGRGDNDELQGGDEADLVYGGPGNDSVGGGGAMGDRLYGGLGNDVLIPGKRFVSLSSGWARTVSCGPGRDYVFEPRRHDIPRDCEQASSYLSLGISPKVRRVGEDAVRLRLHWLGASNEGDDIACRYAVRLRAPFPQRADARPREIGRRVFRLHGEKWRTIRIRLNDYGRSLLESRRPLRVWVQPGERLTCAPRSELSFARDGFTALL